MRKPQLRTPPPPFGMEEREGERRRIHGNLHSNLHSNPHMKGPPGRPALPPLKPRITDFNR